MYEADTHATIMTSTDVQSIKEPAELSSADIREFVRMGSPFLNWSTQELYTFFRSHIVPIAGDNMTNGHWTWHTFAVLDSRAAGTFNIDDPATAEQETPPDGTVLLCCDAPDFLEEDRVVVKEVRVNIEDMCFTTMCYETYVRCPSETGKQTAVVVGPSGFNPQNRRALISYGGLTNDAPYVSRVW